MEDEQRHSESRWICGSWLMVHLPKVSLVKQRKERMDMQEILLHKIIQYFTLRDQKAALKLEVVNISREYTLEVANGKKRVVRVEDV